MKRYVSRFWIILLAATALVAQGLFFIAMPAQADVPSVYTYDHQVTTSLDGDAIVKQCVAYDGTAYESYDANGTFDELVEASTSTTAVGGCGKSIVAPDGTIVFFASIDGVEWEMVAYKNNTLVWSEPIVDLCMNNASPSFNMGIASDNNVFLVLNTSCATFNGVEIVGYNLSTGAVDFQESLGDVSAMGEHVRAFSTGYVYVTDYGEVVYLDQNGQKDVARTFTPSYAMPYWFSLWSVGQNGELAILSTQSGAMYCSGSSLGDTVVVFRDASGVETSRAVPEDPYNEGCGGQSIHITPSGDAVLALRDEYASQFSIAFVSNNSTINTRVQAVNNAGNMISVDMYGNALYQSQYAIPELSNQIQTEFLLFSSAGNLISRYSTEALKSDDNDSFVLSDVRQLATAPGMVWAILRNLYTNEYHMHRIPFAKIGFDYPRGEMLGDTSVTPELLSYVALGDSFSSGEGVGSYLSGTDTSTNSCHRSEHAYPMLLSLESNSTLAFPEFVACSGATTANVLNGQGNELAQTTALNMNTDVVTLTIGGNDIGFKPFAVACVTGLCDIGSSAYNTALSNVNTILPSVLPQTYDAILDELSQDAELYVLGYPHVAPVKTNTDLPPYAWTCPYLYNGNQGTETEVVLDPWGNARGAYDITARINAHIESVVYDISLVDDRIHFIDVNAVGLPFIGHDVCADDPYFANVNSDLPSVFHPNMIGHQKLENIARAAF